MCQQFKRSIQEIITFKIDSNNNLPNTNYYNTHYLPNR